MASLAITRRGFIGSGGALGLASISPRAMAAILDPAPTRIYKGARIHTLDPAIPSADAIAISGSRIVLGL